VRIRRIQDEVEDAHGGIDIAVDALTDIGRMSPRLNLFTLSLIQELEATKGRLNEWTKTLDLGRS